MRIGRDEPPPIPTATVAIDPKLEQLWVWDEESGRAISVAERMRREHAAERAAIAHMDASSASQDAAIARYDARRVYYSRSLWIWGPSGTDPGVPDQAEMDGEGVRDGDASR